MHHLYLKISCTGLLSLLLAFSLQAKIEISDFTHAKNGQCNGWIQVTAEGTAGPFTLLLEGPGQPIEASNVNGIYNFINLCDGDYTITVTNAYACKTHLALNIADCEAISIEHVEAAIEGPSTCGARDGTIYFRTGGPTGGTPPYEMTLQNAIGEVFPQNPNGTWTGLAAGAYHFEVEDVNGCKGELDFEIQGQNLPSLITDVQAACEDINNGYIGVGAISQDPNARPYTFTWSTGEQTTGDYSELNDLEGNRNYYLSVTDNTGECTQVESFFVAEIPSTGPFQIDDSEIKSSCAEQNTGSITLAVSGGNPPYRFNWSHGAHGNNLTNLAPGTYQVTVLDYCNRERSESYTVASYPPLQISAQTIVDCPGESDINLNVSGGTPPYTYEWNNGHTSQDLENVPAGNYQVTLTDVNGCFTILENINLDEDRLNLISQEIQGSCEDFETQIDYETGSVCINVAGGQRPYTYQWSNGQFTPNTNATNECINNLRQGNYALTISDGCQDYTFQFSVFAQDVLTQPYDNPATGECGYDLFCENYNNWIGFRPSTSYYNFDEIDYTEDCETCDCELEEICLATGNVLNTVYGEYSVEFVDGITPNYDCPKMCKDGEFCKKVQKCTFSRLPPDEQIQVVKEELSTIIKVEGINGIPVECNGEGTCTVIYYCGNDNNEIHRFCSDNCYATTSPLDPNYPYYSCNDIVLPDDCSTALVLEPISSNFTDNSIIQSYKVHELKPNNFIINDYFPNPFTDNIQIQITSSFTGELKVELADVTGDIVISRDFFIHKGYNILKINTDNTLTQGIYYLIVSDQYKNREVK
ncbi:MAG: T9SS type A sorting domain-containing protein, partial [Bacteroidota bacterium]